MARWSLIILAIACVVATTVVGTLVFMRRPGGGGNKKDLSATTSFIKPSREVYHYGEPIVLTFKNDNPDRQAWIGIWQAHKSPMGSGFDVQAVVWTYACGEIDCRFRVGQGTLQLDESTSAQANYGLPTFPLCNGQYKAALLSGQDEVVVQSKTFQVIQGDCEGICQLPSSQSDVSNLHHALPQRNSPLSRIAFGSNFHPRGQVGPLLWDHVRNVFEAQLWVWLGNVINESDGVNLDAKRRNYRYNKEDEYYTSVGPLAEPKIPVTGTWDEHDSGYNNGGKEYDCYGASQDEFVYFYDLPNHDPRHPAQGTNQQRGVYSSIPFGVPSGPADQTGIHLILLDVRTFRSATFDDYGPCEGADSTMLGTEQWAWLEKEMKVPSEITVIGSGVPVLSPTNQYNIDVSHYCANDGDTFQSAIRALNESAHNDGLVFETWGQIPQERLRLLRLAQASINAGHTKRVIFVSGDMEWGEMAVKRMPPTDDQASQLLYEVTASGIDGHEETESFNANRLRVRSADARGDGVYQYECQLPFTLGGVEYKDCTMASGNPESTPERPWCSIANDPSGEHIAGEWGYCLGSDQELVDEANIGYSYEYGCSGSPFHVCSAQGNYGGLEVDWSNRTILLQLFTPYANEARAAVVQIDF